MRWAPLLVCASAVVVSIGVGSYDAYLARLKADVGANAELQEAKPRELRRILREHSAALLPAHAAPRLPQLSEPKQSTPAVLPGRQTTPTLRGALGTCASGCSCAQ